MEPASIRTKNPGAMWGSALAVKWGANRKAVTLNDGKGQGNNIAVFPTYVAGICAQLDLWRTSPRYKNKTFAQAIAVWSGGNNVESYIDFVLKRCPGMSRYTVMNDDFWRSPLGISFLKAQAWHEAGRPYPAPEDDWFKAQAIVMGAKKQSSPMLAEMAPPKSLMQSGIMKGAATTAGSIAVSAGAKLAENANTHTEQVATLDTAYVVAEKMQQASDTIMTVTTMKDNATSIVQVAKPFVGLASSTWGIIALVAIGVAAIAIAWTMYERYAKMRDEGV